MYHPNNFLLLSIDLNKFWTGNKDAINIPKIINPFLYPSISFSYNHISTKTTHAIASDCYHTPAGYAQRDAAAAVHESSLSALFTYF